MLVSNVKTGSNKKGTSFVKLRRATFNGFVNWLLLQHTCFQKTKRNQMPFSFQTKSAKSIFHCIYAILSRKWGRLSVTTSELVKLVCHLKINWKEIYIKSIIMWECSSNYVYFDKICRRWHTDAIMMLSRPTECNFVLLIVIACFFHRSVQHHIAVWGRFLLVYRHACRWTNDWSTNCTSLWFGIDHWLVKIN